MGGRYKYVFWGAIVVAALATFGAYRYLQANSAPAKVVTRSVVIANVDIPEGAAIDRAHRVQVFAVGQRPGQDFLATGFGPNTQGDQDATLETALDRPLAPFTILAHLAVGAQLRDVDAIQLQNRRHPDRCEIGRQSQQLMEALVERA